ncbi:MAG: hypothetical protein COA58_03310 [Bacteroidetes bacterium]|nr:MAG: hypothetical protein COA58_03310 [Bacteroidota bacterium]
MTPQEFKQKLDHKYGEAKKLSAGDDGFRIKRGTAHVISGYAEDLFALYAAQIRKNRDCTYLVDHSISYRETDGARAKTCKPDLAILDNGKLTHYYDLKMNLGFSRDLGHFMQEKQDLINGLKTADTWASVTVGEKKERWGITIPKTLVYHIVVLYGWNISEEQMKANEALENELSNVELTILFPRKGKDVEISEEAFAILDKSLESISELKR